MGSSASDLDSIVGSVAYAYLLHREGTFPGPVFAYLPVPGEDFVLRPEAVYLFERLALRREELVFADTVELENLITVGQGELILVDTQGQDLAPGLRGRLTEVIDHHPQHPAGADIRRGLRRWIVEPVGSVSTLVSEQVMLRKPEILTGQLADFLLAALLLDTVNLEPKAGRATPRDEKAARLLLQRGSADTTGLYEGLTAARADVRGQSSDQLLRKDYKVGFAGSLRLGMCSVPLLIDTWRKRDRLLATCIGRFLAERNLDLVAVFLYEQKEDFHRQLLLCSREEGLLGRVVSRLRSKSLGLREMPAGFERPEGDGKRPDAAGQGGGEEKRADAGGGELRIRAFEQADLSASRKRMEPLLREVLRADGI